MSYNGPVACYRKATPGRSFNADKLPGFLEYATC